MFWLIRGKPEWVATITGMTDEYLQAAIITGYSGKDTIN